SASSSPRFRSASASMRSTSPWSRLPCSLIVMLCSLPVSLSRAVTFRIPFAFALQHHDVHGGLIVFRCGEHFAAPGRDRRVALDDLGHHPALRLDAEG